MTDTLQRAAEQRLARLKHLAAAIESRQGLTLREYAEVAATLRQLIEDIEGNQTAQSPTPISPGTEQ